MIEAGNLSKEINRISSDCGEIYAYEIVLPIISSF